MASADGKGRTLFQILLGKNKRDLRPLELQYHNPLGAKVGNCVSFNHEEGIAGVNFFVEKIAVYETRVHGKKFYHTDYLLRGQTLDMDHPIRLRLRLMPDDSATNQLGCKVLVMYLYHEQGWDEGLFEVLNDPMGEFHVNQDDDGNDLEEPWKYWRIEDVKDPYHARVTLLSDTDGDGTVEDEELERLQVTYWDFARDTYDEQEVQFTEYLTIELDETVVVGEDGPSRYFTFFRGTEVDPEQIMVI